MLNNNEPSTKIEFYFVLKIVLCGHRVKDDKDPELDKIKRETFYFRWQELPSRVTLWASHRPVNQTKV